MNTGKVIKECRESLNWSRPYLGEMADVSTQTISNAEQNKDCRVSTLEKLLHAMGYCIEIKRIPWP